MIGDGPAIKVFHPATQQSIRFFIRSNARLGQQFAGGGASPERVAKAFRLVLSDSNVQAVLVNIFAGINRCDWVAEGVVQVLKELNLEIPVVVRLAGTNVEEGQKILAQSGLPVIRANTLMEAAQRAVSAWKSDAFASAS